MANLLFDRISKQIKERWTGVTLHAFLQEDAFFKNKRGLEIGGPSTVFTSNNVLPVYDVADIIDGVDFSQNTVWEDTIIPGYTYNYANDKLGQQYILEASALTLIPDSSYDFLLASHCLEHCANTLKTLHEWKRVVKPGGVILLTLPDSRVTFDHRRTITTIEHIKSDYISEIDETDLTHLDEIMKFHDVRKDLGVSSYDDFYKRSLNNAENRCLHHHVFDISLLEEVFEAVNLRTIFTSTYLPHLIIMGQNEEYDY